ncbi:MAG TPA: cell division protein FtsL [Acidimicrobiales bacterium]|nr:cell division protein FtsL [Acidimicrobiales bacterium]
MTAPVLDPRRPAPAPSPSSAPSRPAPVRPPLRVVAPEAPERDREAERRRLVRLLVLVGAVGLALCIFGIVVSHVVLTQNQFRLDALQDQALERQAEYDRLRLEVAQLESPDRIVADAQQRLGMVAAPKITYLTPTVEDTPGDPSRAARDAEDAAAGTNWSVVKPHLADG